MKPKVLITGGSGLLALNWAVAVRDNHAVMLCKHHREFQLKNVHTRFLNIESIDDIRRMLDDMQPEFVVHTAGLTSVEKCESQSESAKYLNVQLAKNVAEACAKTKVPFVHISTDHLFKGDQSLVNEQAILSPVNVYAKTKAEAENQVLDSCSNALIVRTNFYGWGTSYRKSFSDLVLTALRNKKKITLYKDVYYTPILVEELALLVHELVAAKASGIFNIVGDDRVSKYEFGMKLASKFSLDSSLIQSGNIVENKSLVKRPLDMSLSNKKISFFLNKKIGGLNEHLARLENQEVIGLSRELQKL